MGFYSEKPTKFSIFHFITSEVAPIFLLGAELHWVGTAVRNSRCPTRDCLHSGASWVAIWHGWVVERHCVSIWALRKQSQWIPRHCFNIEQNLQSRSNSQNFIVKVYIDLFIYECFFKLILLFYSSTLKIENIQNTLWPYFVLLLFTLYVQEKNLPLPHPALQLFVTTVK